MIVNTYLKNNRPVTVADYMKTFKLCRQTAAKRRAFDIELSGVKSRHWFMTTHFFDAYCRYPVNFEPVYGDIFEKVAKAV